MSRQIILASTSPRRKQLMEQIGLKFDIVPSDFEEDMTQNLEPSVLAKQLAYGKAKAVADRYPEAVVIGADTIVVFNKEVLGKPKDEENARTMLRKLRGNDHQIITGLSIICLESRHEFLVADISRVYMNDVTDEEIDQYIASGEPMDKAGAYAIQGQYAKFIYRIEGDCSSVIGLPVSKVWQILKQID